MKKLLYLMLVLMFTVLITPQVARADLLADAGIDGGMETDADDNDWPDGFGYWGYWGYVHFMEEEVSEWDAIVDGGIVPDGATPDPNHFMELVSMGIAMITFGKNTDYPIPLTEGTQYQASALFRLRNPSDPTEYMKDVFHWKVEFFNVNAVANGFPDGDRFDEDTIDTLEDAQGIISNNGGWLRRRVTFTVPDKTPDVGYLVMAPHTFDWDTGWSNPQTYLIDDFELIEAAYAYDPSPGLHQSANFETVTPSWNNPAGASVTNCVVEMSVDDANMIYPTELYSGSLVTEVTHQDLVDAGISLGLDKNYFWRVNYDGTPGDIWHFTTFNATPEVTVDVGEGDGETLYTWLGNTPDPCDPCGNVVVQIDAGYTDDDRPGPIDPCDVRWTVNSDGRWTTDDPNYILNPTLKMYDAQSYTIQYNVSDGEETGTRSATINVSEDACGAAKADPDDARLVGDHDYDCDQDIYDLAAFVEDWLRCMSAKLEGYSAPGFGNSCP
jgi:hypothetical protein